MGGPAGIHGTIKPLSFDDAEAIERLPLIKYAVPVSGANGEIESDTRLRRSLIVGTGADYDQIVGADTMLGQYLPKDNPKTPRSYAVLGPKMRDELFGNENPLGKTIRVNSQRFRVIGVLPPKGDFLGFDLDDAFIYQLQSLIRCSIKMDSKRLMLFMKKMLQRGGCCICKKTHDQSTWREDFTITTRQIC
ncbi:MAG: hypothetical protein Ct9H90mP13_00680 [Pseudomonadota bacterium]|nr:MAG: hypothetical protein Ct9H90mP13_00680 [Pseudomonadota bacterium]